MEDFITSYLECASPLSRYCKAYGEFHLWADFEAGKVRS